MAKVYPYKDGVDDISLYVFFCPGCKYDHPFRVKPQGARPVWSFNGNVNEPTFSPSLLVFKDDPTKRCHLIMTNGKIQFCSDCFHDLKNKTVDCPEYEEN
jgi:hypothetical protein